MINNNTITFCCSSDRFLSKKLYGHLILYSSSDFFFRFFFCVSAGVIVDDCVADEGVGCCFVF